ncbi:hypothetical protein Tco_0968288 [Tanacetum coccineum]
MTSRPGLEQTSRPLARWLLESGKIITLRAEWMLSLSVWFWVGHPYNGSNGDGTGGGDECADGAVHLVRRSPTEGGDSEVSGDGSGVSMARSLSSYELWWNGFGS